MNGKLLEESSRKTMMVRTGSATFAGVLRSSNVFVDRRRNSGYFV